MKPGIKNSGRGVLFFLAWIFLWGMTMGSDQVLAVEAMNVRLVGHNDIQGRETLQVVLKGNYAYVGHHKGDELNPLTGKVEPNGTSIIDVSNPAQPKVIQTNDVDLDYRGLIYITDRSGTGLHILEYMGRK